MNHHARRIAADVPVSTRNLLLRMFPPRFDQVFCRGMTWAYGVDETFDYPKEERLISIIGRHTSDTTEALICSFGPDRIQPLTHRPLFIALSTAPGVPPADAGKTFDYENGDWVGQTNWLDRPVTFEAQLQSFPLWQQKPARRAA